MHACGQPAMLSMIGFFIFELPSRSNFPDF
jgi:hypothetical protein